MHLPKDCHPSGNQPRKLHARLSISLYYMFSMINSMQLLILVVQNQPEIITTSQRSLDRIQPKSGQLLRQKLVQVNFTTKDGSGF